MSTGKIERVEQSIILNNDANSKWLPIIKNLNPMSAISEAYAKTLAYRIEVKRLDAEITRINKQAEIALTAIDKTYQIKMEELSHRRIAIEGFFKTVQNELHNKHLERVEILKMAQNAQSAAFDPQYTLEEKKMYSEMLMQLTAQIPLLGQNASVELANLVQALPKVEIASKLLEN